MTSRAPGWLADRLLAGIVVCAASAPLAADPAHFDTDYGPMFLEQQGEQVSGFYPDYRGLLEGVLDGDGDWLRGWWTQPDSERRCERERHGARHWGSFEFRGITGDSFEGFWAFCDDATGSGGGWNGRRSGGGRLLRPAEVPSGEQIHLPDASR